MEAKKRLLWKFRGGWLSILETGLEGDGLEQGFPGKWLFGGGGGVFRGSIRVGFTRRGGCPVGSGE